METKPSLPSHNTLGIWRYILWLLVVIFVASFYIGNGRRADIDDIVYSEFKRRVRADKVASVTIDGNRISGAYRASTDADAETAESAASETIPGTKRFQTVKPDMADPDLLPLLEARGVEVDATIQHQSWIWTIVAGLLPWVLIIGFFVFMNRKIAGRMGGGKNGGIFGVGRTRAKRVTKSKTTVNFDDVAGLENAKKEFVEIIAFLKDPSKFRALGGELPKGILLVGPPGVGKTLMAQATAGEAGVPFYTVSGSEFIEMFVGVGASRVRDLFKKAKKETPSIIFVDEIDAVGRSRGTGLGGGHDEREQTLNQILSEMDGFSPTTELVVLAATNRPDVLDPALTRPGRFDRQISLDPPQKQARLEILRTHTRNVPLDKDVDLKTIAGKTAGFTGADLKNLVNEAALLAARHDDKKVTHIRFQEAKDKILLGIKREDVIQDKEKEIIAYHEAGHALAARLLPGADPLDKVTIIPRGRSLGATEQIPIEERHTVQQSDLHQRIIILLGGRAAEQVVFEDVSTGAADDLKKATRLARRMICQWGMNEKIGPVFYRQGEPHPFIGREMAEPKDFSEHTARLIDEEVRRLIGGMEKKAHALLADNRDALDRLASALMAEETVSGAQIDQLVKEAA